MQLTVINIYSLRLGVTQVILLNNSIHVESLLNLIVWRSELSRRAFDVFDRFPLYEEKVGSEFSYRVLKQVFVGQTKEGWI